MYMLVYEVNGTRPNVSGPYRTLQDALQRVAECPGANLVTRDGERVLRRSGAVATCEHVDAKGRCWVPA